MVALARPCLNERPHLLLVLDTPQNSGEALFFSPRRIPQSQAEALPGLVVGDGDASPSAPPPGAVASVGGHEGVAVALAFPEAAVHRPVHDRLPDAADGSLVLSEVNVLALAAAPAVNEGRYNG